MLKTDSIVSAALKEQKHLNLPVKGLLEIYDISHKDRVSAFRILLPLK